MDLKALNRFENSKDTFKLTKIDSKRVSKVGVGQFEVGYFSLVDIPASSEGPVGIAVMVGRSFDYIRTSPIVKIVDETDTSTTFETEGGIYRLEKI